MKGMTKYLNDFQNMSNSSLKPSFAPPHFQVEVWTVAHVDELSAASLQGNISKH